MDGEHLRDGTSLFGNAGLFWVHYIHDDTSLEHLGKADLDSLSGNDPRKMVTRKKVEDSNIG